MVKLVISFPLKLQNLSMWLSEDLPYTTTQTQTRAILSKVPQLSSGCNGVHPGEALGRRRELWQVALRGCLFRNHRSAGV